MSTSIEKSWEWPNNRWENRKGSIWTVIQETILLLDQIIETRETYLQESEDSTEYGLLNKYSKGNIAKNVFTVSNQTQTEGLKECKILLESLRDTVLNPLFENFKTKFLGEKPQKLSRFTVNFVFRTLLEQISTDVNLIQQGIQQRQIQECEAKGLNKDESNNSGNPNLQITHQGFVLQVADVLAMNAIKPALREGDNALGLTEDTAVITLLQENTSIRLIPYQNVMLLSLPYSAMSSNGEWLSNDFLSIPHEIGHHLYWFKRNEQTNSFKEHLTQLVWGHIYKVLDELKNQEQEGLAQDYSELQRLQWYFHWLEEIFADAFGCRISGPITALSFQELLANGAPIEEDGHHDGKHPIPAIRPLIQTQLLLKMGQIKPSQKEKLDENWERWVQANWHNWITADSLLNQEFEIAGMDEKLTGKEILETLDPIMNIIAACVNNLLSDPNHGVHENWSMGWENDDLNSLYTSYAEGQFISKLQSMNDIQAGIDTQGRARTTQIPRIDVTLSRGESDLKDRIDDWVELVLFANWTREGPEDSHSGR